MGNHVRQVIYMYPNKGQCEKTWTDQTDQTPKVYVKQNNQLCRPIPYLCTAWASGSFRWILSYQDGGYSFWNLGKCRQIFLRSCKAEWSHGSDMSPAFQASSLVCWSYCCGSHSKAILFRGYVTLVEQCIPSSMKSKSQNRQSSGWDWLPGTCFQLQLTPSPSMFQTSEVSSFSMVNPVNPVNSMRNLSSDQIHSANNPQMLQSFFVTFKGANDPHVIGQNDDPPRRFAGSSIPSFDVITPKTIGKTWKGSVYRLYYRILDDLGWS